jgi:hypothetical protein
VIFRYLETGLSDAVDGAWQLRLAPIHGLPVPVVRAGTRRRILSGEQSVDARRAKALAEQQFIGPRMPGVLSAA